MKWNQWMFVVAALLMVSACTERTDDPSCEEGGTNCLDVLEPAGDVDIVGIEETDDINDGPGDDVQTEEDVASDVEAIEDVEEDTQSPDEDVSSPEDVETPPEDTEEPPVDVDPTACSGVVDCFLETCAPDDDDCVEACVSSADEEVQAQAMTMIECLQQSCLKPAICEDDEPIGGDCTLSCLYLECGEAFEICVDPESEGNGKCEFGLECVLECFGKPGQSECISACFGQLSDDAKEKLAAFGACIFDPNIPPAGLEACIAAGGACFGQVTGNGEKNCLDTFLCIEENCAEEFADDEEHDEEGDEDEGSDGPPPCIFECLSEATAEASSLVVAIFGCDMDGGDEEEGAGGFPCSEELLLCAEPSGTLDCDGVMQCLEGCDAGEGGNEQSCLLTCLHQASNQGVSDFFAVGSCPNNCQLDCAEEADPDKCMQSCFETKCGPLFDVCFGSQMP